MSKNSQTEYANEMVHKMTTSQEMQPLLVDESLLEPLAKAVSDAGFDFSDILGNLHMLRSNKTPAQGCFELELADYFDLLGQLSRKTGDETFHLSKRPLMQGALHFALSQCVLAATFEGALQSIAKSFNMLHGGNYNHVIYRDNMLVYSVDNRGFPYPFELNAEQSHSLMECILVLMHSLFMLIAPHALDQCLIKVCTKRPLANVLRSGNQLSFWRARVCGKSPIYSLAYDISAASLPVQMNSDSLPAPDAIYGLVADSIRDRAAHPSMALSCSALIATQLRKRIQTESEIAALNGVSKRTLRRRLRQENTTFRDLYFARLNERSREMLAREYLVEEVAEELGYADARSFRRAFLRWNKMTPTEFRRARAS